MFKSFASGGLSLTGSDFPTGNGSGSDEKHIKANNHNVLKFDVAKWNMFIMVKLNVLMKINLVLSVPTNAILDSNWSAHASGKSKFHGFTILSNFTVLAKFMS